MSQVSEIRIYQDVTESMRGFLLAAKEPPYHRVLDSIDMAALETGSRNISFWQFGTIVSELSREARHDQKTYLRRQGYENNDYKVVFRHTSVAALTIIVTDLFQSDNDFPAVTAEIESHYFATAKGSVANTGSTDNAVAILGARVAFKGPIYDVGRSHGQMSYEGERPLYVLALGPKEQVAQYIRGLQGSLKKEGVATDPKIMLLSPALVKCWPAIDVPLVSEPQLKQIHTDSAGGLTLSNMDVVDNLTESHSPLIKQFMVGADAAHLAFALPVYTLDFGPDLNKDSLVATSTADRFTNQSSPTFQAAPEGADALQFKLPITTISSETSSILRLTADLHPEKLVQGQIYRFSIKVQLDRDKIADPRWVNEWSLSPPKQDGAKTENLAPFLFTLRAQMMSNGLPEMLNAFLYVRKR